MSGKVTRDLDNINLRGSGGLHLNLSQFELDAFEPGEKDVGVEGGVVLGGVGRFPVQHGLHPHMEMTRQLNNTSQPAR